MRSSFRRTRDNTQLSQIRHREYSFEPLAQHENWLNSLPESMRTTINRGSFVVGLAGVSVGIGKAWSQAVYGAEYGWTVSAPALVISTLIGSVALAYNRLFFSH